MWGEKNEKKLLLILAVEEVHTLLLFTGGLSWYTVEVLLNTFLAWLYVLFENKYVVFFKILVVV